MRIALIAKFLVNIFALTVLCALPGFVQAYGQGYYQSYYQTYYQSTYQSYYTPTTTTYQTTFTNNVQANLNFGINSELAKSLGTFVIDHPLDPKNLLLYHSFVESPDVKNLYDGIATLNKDGEATVKLPAYFEALNKDFRYQLKPLGASMPNLYIKQEVKDNQFTIAGGTPGGRVSWQVTGVRHDAYILANPVKVEVEKGPGELADKGQYLHPEAYKSSFWSSIGSIVGVGWRFFAGFFQWVWSIL